jgi:FlaA1/EpsC-like NDP-sugar epimerase
MIKLGDGMTLLYISVPRNHIKRVIKKALLDFVVVWCSYTAAFLAGALTTPLNYANGLSFIFFVAVTMLTSLYLFGVYHRIWSRTSGHGINVIINAVGAATFVHMLVIFVMEPRPIPVTVLAMGNLLAMVGFTAVRYHTRIISGLTWRWKAVWLREFPASPTRVLIIGAGESGQTLAWRLKHRFPNSSYKIVGFVDDDPEKRGLYVEGCPVLGNRTDIPRLTEEHNVDLIVVSVHNISGPEFRKILTYCESTKARIKVVPDIFALMNARHSTALLRDVQPEDLLGRNVITRHEAVDLTPVMGKTVLVTGAAGSIGSELSQQLCSYNPVKLLLLDCNESGLHDLVVGLASKYPDVKLVPILADITFRDTLEAVFEDYHPQIVFHAAAYKHVPMLERYPDQAIRVNVGGTRNLAELARDHYVERFVLISTDKAVNPSSVMGATKRICEMLLNSLGHQEGHNTLFTSVRFGNVLGSRGSVVPTFNSQINNGGPVTITHPEMSRYFMSIPEAVNLVIHAACLTKGNDVFLLKMGEEVRILDLAERMIRLRGMRPYVDMDIKFTGMRPGEKLHEQLYDGTAESAIETIHPSIIQLVSHHNEFDHAALLEWTDHILKHGLGSQDNALRKLLWGMTPSEEYAISLN